MLSRIAVEKSGAPEVKSLTAANLDLLWKRAVYGWSKPDQNGEASIAAIHRFFAPMMGLDRKPVLVKLTVKEISGNARNPLYTAEAVDVAGSEDAKAWLQKAAASDQDRFTKEWPSGDVPRAADTGQQPDKKSGGGTPEGLDTASVWVSGAPVADGAGGDFNPLRRP